MREELLGDERELARPLFWDFPTVHGCVNAGLSGEFGRLWVDRRDRPQVAHLDLDFQFLAGDPTASSARVCVEKLAERTAIQATPAWEPLLDSICGPGLSAYDRVAFGGNRFDRDTLESFFDLPKGYRLFRVQSLREVERFAAFDRSLVRNFRDLDHFVEKGIGFAVESHGEIVAGCSSYTIARGEVEIEIDTAKAHRRRGLALATGAALIRHCKDHQLLPCWDAANDGSARLAERLGFVDPTPYRAWYRRPVEST